MSSYCRSFVLVLLFVGLFSPSYGRDSNIGQDYSLITTHLPPWSINGKSGIFPDLIREIESRLNQDNAIETLPWSRAQEYAIDDLSSYIIFPMTRIPPRENLYRWMIKVLPVRLAFATLDSPPKSLEEAKLYTNIVVHQDSPPDHFLEKRKFRNLIKLTVGIGGAPRMLEKRRVNAWFSAIALVEYATKEMTLRNRIKFSPVFHQSWLYIAASKGTSDAIVLNYQRAFNELIEEGVLEDIIRKYKSENVLPNMNL